MQFKTNLVITAIFVALLAFYFYQKKDAEEIEAVAKQAKQLFDFSDHEALKIQFDKADTMISAEKGDDGWRLQSPIETDADEEAIERYLRNLRETEIERVIEDSAAVTDDLSLKAKYGLEFPRLRVHLKLSEPSAFDTIVFGSDSPTERYSYAQRVGPNPEIFTVRAWRFDNLNKSVLDLRDRRVLIFDIDEVRDFSLQSSASVQEQLTVKRVDEGKWRIMPIDRLADGDVVDQFLRTISNGKAESYIVERPGQAEMSRHGFSERFTSVSIMLGEERAEKRLKIGSEAENGKHYAVDASREPIFLVDSTFVAELDKTVFDLRDKKPVRIEERDSIHGIELWRNGDEVFSAKRDTIGGWTITSPPNRDPKSWKLNSLLTDIDGIEVEAFTLDVSDDASIDRARYGLDVPAVRIRLTSDVEDVTEIALGKVDNEAFLVCNGIPSVYRLGIDVLEDLELDLDDVSKLPPDSESIAETPNDLE